MKAAAPPSPAAPGQSGLSAITYGFLIVGLIALSLRLRDHWLHNPDMTHGLFTPLAFAFLIFKARTEPPLAANISRASLNVLLFALLTPALFALAAAGLYALTVAWSHALVDVFLTAAAVLFLGAGLLVHGRASRCAVPLNWTSLVAVVLWVFATPLPPGFATRLSAFLQAGISEAVVVSLGFIGVAVTRHGNILELARGFVGVEEACSGVRSLVSCVFAAFFLSAALVRRPWARVLTVALAAPLAVAMNFLRSLLLTLAADRGVNPSGTWHDLTGYAVLATTTVLLVLIATCLDRPAPVSPVSPAPLAPPSPPPPGPVRRGSALALLAALSAASALILFFWLHTRPAPSGHAAPPDLLAQLPAAAPGWQVTTATDLPRYASVLQTDALAQRAYTRPTARGADQITLYLAYWPRGRASVGFVALHTPDSCWPGAGWTPVAIPRPRLRLRPALADHALPETEHRQFQLGPASQHVWFWHLYAGRPIPHTLPFSPAEIFRLFWREGARRDGDQLFVRISSNLPWDQIQTEPLLADFFQRLRPFGLSAHP